MFDELMEEQMDDEEVMEEEWVDFHTYRRRPELVVVGMMVVW